MADDNHFDDILPEGPLTEPEIQQLRAMIDRERKVSWAFSIVKRVAVYVATFIAAVAAFRSDIVEILKWIKAG